MGNYQVYESMVKSNSNLKKVDSSNKSLSLPPPTTTETTPKMPIQQSQIQQSKDYHDPKIVYRFDECGYNQSTV